MCLTTIKELYCIEVCLFFFHTTLVLLTAMDVSADLTELGRTPLAVVCAGAKSILDIGRTLEVLVSMGSHGIGWDHMTLHGIT